MSLTHGYQKWRDAQAAGFASVEEYDEALRKRERELAEERRRKRTVEAVLEARAAERRKAQRLWWLRDWKTNLAILALLAVIVWVLMSAHFASGAPFAEGQRFDRYRDLIPVEKYRDDPKLLIYDRQTMPRAYQLGGGFHDPNYNISGETPETFKPNGQGGNWNIEFPWSHAGGTDNAKNAGGFKFLILPKPVIYWRDGDHWSWRFAPGSIVGEVLTQKCPDGQTRAYEVRVRHRAQREWNVEVWRPFVSASDLAEAIRGLRPDWRSDAQLRLAVSHLQGERVEPVRFIDSNHTRPQFSAAYSRDVLPPLPEPLVNDLLDRIEFSEATGGTWKGRDCYAPTATSYSIVPIGYAGHAIEMDDQSCRRCHITAGMDGDVVDFQRPKQKYGRIAGSDGIFSLHPVRAGSISHNGATIPPSFYNISGVIERFDPARHVGYPELER